MISCHFVQYFLGTEINFTLDFFSNSTNNLITVSNKWPLKDCIFIYFSAQDLENYSSINVISPIYLWQSSLGHCWQWPANATKPSSPTLAQHIGCSWQWLAIHWTTKHWQSLLTIAWQCQQHLISLSSHKACTWLT